MVVEGNMFITKSGENSRVFDRVDQLLPTDY